MEIIEKLPTSNIINDYQSSWTEDAERLILYADIMGFKERVLTNRHQELKE